MALFAKAGKPQDIRLDAAHARPFEAALAGARYLDRIHLFDGPWEDWGVHPRGVIVSTPAEENGAARISLNGMAARSGVTAAADPFYEGPCDEWMPCADGFIVQRGNALLLNGTTQLYSPEKLGQWRSHPKGFIVCSGGKLLLNGVSELCTVAEQDKWQPHADGAIVSRGEKISINGIRVLCEAAWEAWESHPYGVLVQLKGADDKKSVLSLNGKQTLYTCNGQATWAAHSAGFVIQLQDKLLLNGSTLLYEGEMDDWRAHPLGAVIQKGDLLFLSVGPREFDPDAVFI